MTDRYEKQSCFHRIGSKSGDPRFFPRSADPHPGLYPYIATEMGAHIWDLQAIAEQDLDRMEDRVRDRVWRSRGMCYLVLSEQKAVYFSPSFQRGTLTERPRGGWVMRVSAEEGVDQERAREVARLQESLADQLQDDDRPRMLLDEPGRGVKVTFFALVVKMDAILQAKGWDWNTFLGFCAEHGYTPRTDGRLVAFSAMSRPDLASILEALHEHGLQCEEYPVDYYLINAGDMGLLFGKLADPEIFQGRKLEHEAIVTPHDHEIRLVMRKTGGLWAVLEGVTRNEREGI